VEWGVEVNVTPSFEITTEQPVELIRQLPPEKKRTALAALAGDSAGG
jgi:hypothetical protein